MSELEISHNNNYRIIIEINFKFYFSINIKILIYKTLFETELET